MDDEGTLGDATHRLERPADAPHERQVGVFAIFDSDRDGDLYKLLREQSDSPDSGFSVRGGSKGSSDTEASRESVRSRIRAADQVIVICGEHTDASPQIHTELLIARDEEKPYFLLWGRRGVMCTKPIGAKPADGMYSWTRQFLQDQLDFNLRNLDTELEARGLRRKPRDAGIAPSAGATRAVATRDEAREDPTTELTSR